MQRIAAGSISVHVEAPPIAVLDDHCGHDRSLEPVTELSSLHHGTGADCRACRAIELHDSIEVVCRIKHVALDKIACIVSTSLVLESDGCAAGGDAGENETHNGKLQRPIRPAVLDIALRQQRGSAHNRLREVRNVTLFEESSHRNESVRLPRSRQIGYRYSVAYTAA